MKKRYLLIMAGLVLVTTAGCGSSNKSNESSSASTTAVSKKDKFADQKEVGEGTLRISNVSGDSVTIWVENKEAPKALDFSTKDIDGSKLSYLYVDGKLVDKKELENTEAAISLQKDSSELKTGKHTLQLVQYVDDKEGNAITTFKQQSYMVKKK